MLDASGTGDVEGLGGATACLLSATGKFCSSPLSCADAPKKTLRSTVTLPRLGQKTWCAFTSTLKPSQHASCACTSSLDPSGLCTNTGKPHVWRADRSSGQLYRALKGVLLLSECIAVWFFNQVACLSASPHNDLGRPLVCMKAQICSNRVQLRHSAMLLSCSILWTVSFLAVPDLVRC